VFVYGVVNNLPDKVVQAFAVGASDVHGRALPDRFQAFERRNITRAIISSLILHKRSELKTCKDTDFLPVFTGKNEVYCSERERITNKI
jgi:hypothetical protein